MGDFSDFILFYSTYSFLGWLMETTYASIRQRKFVNRGYLTGFFCPIYGYGAVLILLTSDWLIQSSLNQIAMLIWIALASIAQMTVLEFITGFALERLFKLKWWDYSGKAFNLKGYICLQYSLLWGVLAIVLVMIVHPFISSMIVRLSATIKIHLATILIAYFVIDTIISTLNALKLREFISSFKNMALSEYYEKIIRFKRFVVAFPSLLLHIDEFFKKEIGSLSEDHADKIKTIIKSRFRQLK